MIELILPVLISFFLRLILSFLPGFEVDMGAWFGWSDVLVTHGFSKFYDPHSWTNYTPGYLYLFNPALIFNSSIWGQADSFLSLLMFISFYFLINKNKILLSALFYSFSF